MIRLITLIVITTGLVGISNPKPQPPIDTEYPISMWVDDLDDIRE